MFGAVGGPDVGVVGCDVGCVVVCEWSPCGDAGCGVDCVVVCGWLSCRGDGSLEFGKSLLGATGSLLTLGFAGPSDVPLLEASSSFGV